MMRVMTGNYTLITHCRTTLEVRTKTKVGVVLFRGAEEQGQVLVRGLMVCKLSQPEFNLRHCSDRESNVQPIKRLQLLPSCKERLAAND